jgi:hypothetical protein
MTPGNFSSFDQNHLLGKHLVRSFKFIGLCLLTLWTFALSADTFQLNDGRTITGELLPSSANDAGVQIKTGDGTYDRFSWSEFSQSALKNIAQKPKLGQFVEPFIEIPVEERLKKTEVKINEVPRLNLPPKGSIFGGLLGSSVGIICLLLIYAGNIYAGYEVATVRARPVPLVCAVSAVAPIIGPVIFLCLPTVMEKAPETGPAHAPVEEAAPAPEAATAEQAAGLHFAQQQAAAAPTHPETQVFQRGQFTFNRRFIETKFSGFFGMVRRDADKEMVLLFKTARGEFIANRITRIAASDLHAEIQKGGASAEVAIPFGEIQEIQLKHKDA